MAFDALHWVVSCSPNMLLTTCSWKLLVCRHIFAFVGYISG